MDAITNQGLEVKVKAVDAKLVMEGFGTIANRITTGIVLGSLILATVGGFWLVINILVQDHRTRKRTSR